MARSKLFCGREYEFRIFLDNVKDETKNGKKKGMPKSFFLIHNSVIDLLFNSGQLLIRV